MRHLTQLFTTVTTLAVLATATLAAAPANVSPAPTDKERREETTRPRVLLETPLGDILIEIDDVAAPVTAANFLAHVDEGLFADARFYRVVRLDNQPENEVKIEVVQGGLGFEATSPRPSIPHETTAMTGLRHLDGTVSMARLDPGTASSEFFICIGEQPELDYGGRRNPDGQGFAAFGQVIAGMEVVRRIQQGEARGQMLLEPVSITATGRMQ